MTSVDEERKPFLDRLLRRATQVPASPLPLPNGEKTEYSPIEDSTSSSRHPDQFSTIISTLGGEPRDGHSWQELQDGFSIASRSFGTHSSSNELDRLSRWAEYFHHHSDAYDLNVRTYSGLWIENIHHVANLVVPILAQESTEQEEWTRRHHVEIRNLDHYRETANANGTRNTALFAEIQSARTVCTEAANSTRAAAEALRRSEQLVRQLAFDPRHQDSLAVRDAVLHALDLRNEALRSSERAINSRRHTKAVFSLVPETSTVSAGQGAANHTTGNALERHRTLALERLTVQGLKNQQHRTLALERLGAQGLKNRHWYASCPTYLDLRVMPGADPEPAVQSAVQRLRRSGGVFVLRETEVRRQTLYYTHWLTETNPEQRRRYERLVRLQAEDLKRALVSEQLGKGIHIVQVSDTLDPADARASLAHVTHQAPDARTHMTAIVNHADAGYVMDLAQENQDQKQVSVENPTYTTPDLYREKTDQFLSLVETLAAEFPSTSVVASGRSSSYATIERADSQDQGSSVTDACRTIINPGRQLLMFGSRYLARMHSAVRSLANRILSDTLAPVDSQTQKALERDVGRVFSTALSRPSQSNPDRPAPPQKLLPSPPTRSPRRSTRYPGQPRTTRSR